mgnify:CR=1
GAIIAAVIDGRYAVKATNVKMRATSRVFCAKLTSRTEMILKAVEIRCWDRCHINRSLH